MKKKLLLIKAGGSILQDEQLILSLCADIKAIADRGHKIILVHGGGKAINEALTEHGVASQFIDGLRVTSSFAIEIIERVLYQQVNKNLVSQLNHSGVSAIGLSGAENQMLLCDLYSQQHGYVGDITTVNPTNIKQSCSLDAIPVIATLGVNKEGEVLNINADMAACHIANTMKVDQLIYLTDQDGIYNHEGKLFPKLNKENLNSLIHHAIVSGGMLVKVNAILASLKAGLNQILVLNGKHKQILLDAILYEKQPGTLCQV
jgi:acetylglutamate kinase